MDLSRLVKVSFYLDRLHGLQLSQSYWDGSHPGLYCTWSMYDNVLVDTGTIGLYVADDQGVRPISYRHATLADNLGDSRVYTDDGVFPWD